MFSPCLARLAGLLSVHRFPVRGRARRFAASGGAGRASAPGRNDGWASVPTAALPQGTTGGSAPPPPPDARRHEPQGAAGGTRVSGRRAPKLIHVKGTIDLNVDDNNKPLTCRDYYQPDPATGEMYSLDGFLAMYDPAGPLLKADGKNKEDPCGGQEEARLASARGAGRARARSRAAQHHDLRHGRRRHADRCRARHRGSSRKRSRPDERDRAQPDLPRHAGLLSRVVAQRRAHGQLERRVRQHLHPPRHSRVDRSQPLRRCEDAR